MTSLMAAGGFLNDWTSFMSAGLMVSSALLQATQEQFGCRGQCPAKKSKIKEWDADKRATAHDHLPHSKHKQCKNI
jgi:hypothetical protein